MNDVYKILSTLAIGLAEAVVKDEHPDSGGFDLSAGMFGPAVSEWLRSVAQQLATAGDEGKGKNMTSPETHIHIHLPLPLPSREAEVLAALGELRCLVTQLTEKVTMNAADFKAKLEAMTAQAEKTKAETLALLEQIANQSDDIPEDIVAQAEALAAVLQAQDDAVPDLEPPAPPAEPAV